MALQCPTRVFVARHAQAEYESELLSDAGGSLTALGRRQARELADRLKGERISRIWTSPLSRAVQTAEIAAATLGVDVVVREDLREYGVGSLAGTAGDEAATIGPVFLAWTEGDDEATIDGGDRVASIVARVRTAIEEVADEHRGEAVLVVSHGGVILATVPQLLGLPRGYGLGSTLPNCGVIALEVDADGWRIASGSFGSDLFGP